MVGNRDIILKEILRCNENDLSIIDDIVYDLDVILTNMISDGVEIDLNTIVKYIFEQGIENLVDIIENRLNNFGEDLEDIADHAEDEELDECLSKRLDLQEELKMLNPKEDIIYNCELSSSTIGIRCNKIADLYTKHYDLLGISDIELNIGFPIIRMNPSFKYGGLSFIPQRQFAGETEKDFLSVSANLYSDLNLGFWNKHQRSDYKFEYDYDGFYVASTSKDCDIFYCIETKKFYVPCQNELFGMKSILWSGEKNKDFPKSWQCSVCKNEEVPKGIHNFCFICGNNVKD